MPIAEHPRDSEVVKADRAIAYLVPLDCLVGIGGRR
jgi:hypothetical protein